MTHDPDALTLAMLIYERDGWHKLWLCDTSEGYRLSEKLFTERHDGPCMDRLFRRSETGQRASSRVLAVWLDDGRRHTRTGVCIELKADKHLRSAL
jgi:hypothetical protein